MWMWVGMMVMGVLISCMAVLLTSLRCNLTASFQQGWITQFRIFFLQAGLVFDATTPVAQCFWIATIRIVPTCRPRRASRTRLRFATDGEGGVEAFCLLAAAVRAGSLIGSAGL